MPPLKLDTKLIPPARRAIPHKSRGPGELVIITGMSGSGKASVLKAFDRPEWVAQDQDEYVSIVCSLAHDVAGRTKQRKMQRSRMRLSPLCDAKEMARCMEDVSRSQAA